MRVALVRQRYAPFGGAEIYTQRVAEMLLSHGHELHLLTHRWAAPLPGAVVHRLPVLPGGVLRTLSFAWVAAVAARRGCYDAVLSFDRTLCTGVYRAGEGCHREWLCRRAGVQGPAARLVTGLHPRHRALLWLERRLFTNPGVRIVATAVRGREEIARHYGRDPDGIAVVRNGVALERFTPATPEERVRMRVALGLPQGAWTLLAVGSGFERKGVRFLLEALTLLRAEGWKDLVLLVAGKGRVRPLARLARARGIADVVRWLGPTRRVQELYAASDLFVLPSLYDPFSSACLEALACGLPVVTSRWAGASELLDGTNGSVVREPTDAAEIAARIREWLDRDRLRAGGEAARATALRHPLGESVAALLSVVQEGRA